MIYLQKNSNPPCFHKIIGTRVYIYIHRISTWTRCKARNRRRQLEVGLTTGNFETISEAHFEALLTIEQEKNNEIQNSNV